jgi:hypothetical protein
VITVAVKESRLSVQLTGQPAVDAFPESDKDFFLKVVDAQLTVHAERGGKGGRGGPAPGRRRPAGRARELECGSAGNGAGTSEVIAGR